MGGTVITSTHLVTLFSIASIHFRETFVWSERERKAVELLGYHMIHTITSKLILLPSVIVATILVQHPYGISRGAYMD